MLHVYISARWIYFILFKMFTRHTIRDMAGTYLNMYEEVPTYYKPTSQSVIFHKSSDVFEFLKYSLKYFKTKNA